MRALTVTLITLLWTLALQAGAVSLRDYGRLRLGMSEAEVLTRIGEPDRERIINNDFTYQMIWYYIPDGSYSGAWTTTIFFDANGRIKKLERDRFPK